MLRAEPNNNLSLFTGKANTYVNSRPSYPKQLVNYMKCECNLNYDSCIVDIGCGTGKLAEIFLQEGYCVTGCEPSADMRYSAEALLKQYGEKFKCIDACGEETSLPTASVDLIIIANTLHLLQGEKAMQEFKRILKPNGRIAVLYNFRNPANELSAEYETLLLKYSSKYERFTKEYREDKYINHFFGSKGYQLFTADNPHSLTMEQYIDRFYSSAWLNKNDFSVVDKKLFESEAKTTFRRCLSHQQVTMTDDGKSQIPLLYESRLYLSSK